MLRINESGLALIKQYETCHLRSRLNAAGMWTIGWGHTLTVDPQAVLTQEEADQLLADDIESLEASIFTQVEHGPTSRNEFSAMVSLALSIGYPAFRFSNVLKAHVERQYTAAASAFLFWDKVHVDDRLVRVPGLLVRRYAERDLYLTAP